MLTAPPDPSSETPWYRQLATVAGILAAGLGAIGTGVAIYTYRRKRPRSLDDIHTDTVEEYGVEPTPEGARRWQRITAPPEKIESPAYYVSACRRLAHSIGYEDRLEGEGRIDGRLVAMGWGHFSPTRWLKGGKLREFVRYWKAAVERPETVGSSRNTLSPEMAFAAWQADIPPYVAGALGDRLFRTIKGKDRVWTVPRWRRVTEAQKRRLGAMAKAVKRTSAAYRCRWGRLKLSTQLLVALGRMSPELQRVALATIPEDRCDVVRVRDVDWSRVAQAQRDIAHDPTGRVRAAYAFDPGAKTEGGARFTKMLPQDDTETSTWLCPTYPNVPVKTAIRLARGVPPEQIAEGQLTRREAHEWLTTAPDLTPAQFLVRRLERRLSQAVPPLRSANVARWLLEVERRGAWKQLTRPRTIHAPGGDVFEYKFIDRLDEIQDEDLVAGVKTGVEAAYEHAAERAGAAWLEEARADHRVLASLPSGWRLYRSMRHLATPAALVTEGQEMHHCVGGYVPAVQQGKSVILAINVLGHRSTVELTREGEVLQHRGPHNETPHPLCERVLSNFLKRLPRKVGA